MAKLISIEDLIKYTNILDYFTKPEIFQGASITPRCNIELIDEEDDGDSKIFSFYVEVHNYYYERTRVDIKVNKDKIEDIYCTCNMFNHYDHCIHIAAVIISETKLLFDIFKDNKRISNILLDHFVIDNKPTIKKEVDVELSLVVNKTYYDEYFFSCLNVH